MTYLSDCKKEKEVKRQELLKTIKSFTSETVKLDKENVSVQVTDDFPIYIRDQGTSWNRKNQYTFSLWDKLPYIDYNSKKRIKEKYNEPKGVGVMNSKKLTEWLEYLKKVYLDLVNLSKEKVNKVNTFMTEVKEVKGLKLNTYNQEKGGHRGEIVKGGLEYSFEIDYSSGWISEKIEVHYSTEKTLDNFLKLSLNLFKTD